VKQGQPKKRNEAEKQANSFLAKGEGFSICAFFLQIEISFLDKHSESSVFG
jgi:hypothetical protein